ncbi:MAG: hypothetical protein JWN37_301 [Candidatus Nomurabacteria bacterium]|nr:hypothetical protein [Candidatus Nomurabacteria bacterium]
MAEQTAVQKVGKGAMSGGVILIIVLIALMVGFTLLVMITDTTGSGFGQWGKALFGVSDGLDIFGIGLQSTFGSLLRVLLILLFVGLLFLFGKLIVAKLRGGGTA